MNGRPINKIPSIEIVSTVSAQDRAVDPVETRRGGGVVRADRKLYTGSTASIPTDGIVKETSNKIVGGSTSDIEKARKICEWVIENTARNASTRGCGIGDIAAMLKTGNRQVRRPQRALHVGLARAADVPARDVYGHPHGAFEGRIPKPGCRLGDITRAPALPRGSVSERFRLGAGRSCRCSRVVLEEPPANPALSDPKVAAARAALFSAWEDSTGWLYNFARDAMLPGAKGPAVEFLMYPQAETIAGRLDCLDPDSFEYTITSKEVNV